MADRHDTPFAVEATDPAPDVPAAAGAVLELDPQGAVLPETCACCGDLAPASRLESRATGESLIVPYCTACLRHAQATRTRALAVTLASTLLALCFAAGLPLAFPWLSSAPLVAITVLGSLLPLVFAQVIPRSHRAPHSSWGRAVWWTAQGQIACSNPSWGEQFAALNGTTAKRASQREPRISPWMITGPVLAVLSAPFLHWLHHPLVRVINLTEVDLIVLADGHVLAELWPSSAESPQAGVEVRVPAGRRLLEAKDRRGRLVSQDNVVIHSGRHHLYAPGPHPYCFWIETVGYGRGAPEEPAIEPLPEGRGFWVLPPGIDTWFRPNPHAAEDRRASGGQLSALRQGRCSEVPTGEDR